MSKEMKRLTEKQRIQWCYSFNSSKQWLRAIQLQGVGSRHTLREYSRALFTFCQWLDKNPDQLITDRKQELKNPETKKNAEEKVTEFCLKLEHERNITKTTIVTKYLAVLKSFYKYNDVPLKIRTPRYVKRRREPHTTEQIKKLMMIGDIREKAIMMFLKDSGMSREDAAKLTYGDIKNELEKEQQAVHIKAVREKQAIEYDTFIGKNAIEHLKAYIDYRKNMGEQITEDSPLLATVSGKPLTPETLSIVFVRLSKKAGFKTSPHRFRKYFESHLGLSVPSIVVKYWMGHSLGVESSYFLPPIEKQKEKYLEAYHEIDIFEREVSEVERRKQAILDSARLMPNMTEAKIELLKDWLKGAMSMEELEERLKKRLEMFKQLEEEDCQKLIDPEQLEDYLKKGWKYIAQINGKIVMESNGSNE